ncbi:hypothetical protein HY570_00065 [Candidatus Micrarchaeota archaeon]|nr:hypothetical protein [Candidatus Micrarchaeota archaeon]
MQEQTIKKNKKPVDLTVVPQRMVQPKPEFQKQRPELEEITGIKKPELIVVPKKIVVEETLIEQPLAARIEAVEKPEEKVQVARESSLAVAYKRVEEILRAMRENVLSIPAALKELVESLRSIVQYSERVLIAARERPKTVADLFAEYEKSSGKYVG